MEEKLKVVREMLENQQVCLCIQNTMICLLSKLFRLRYWSHGLLIDFVRWAAMPGIPTTESLNQAMAQCRDPSEADYLYHHEVYVLKLSMLLYIFKI